MTTTISMLAIDLAQGSFQVCAVGPDGMVVFNRAMSRTRLATLLADHPACIVAIEACATSHHWGRTARRRITGVGLRENTAMRCGSCRRPT